MIIHKENAIMLDYGLLPTVLDRVIILSRSRAMLLSLLMGSSSTTTAPVEEGPEPDPLDLESSCFLFFLWISLFPAARRFRATGGPSSSCTIQIKTLNLASPFTCSSESVSLPLGVLGAVGPPGVLAARVLAPAGLAAALGARPVPVSWDPVRGLGPGWGSEGSARARARARAREGSGSGWASGSARPDWGSEGSAA